MSNSQDAPQDGPHSSVMAPGALRRARGEIRQSDLGRMIGHKGGSTISRWEKGESLPETATVAKLETALKVTDGRLMTARQVDYDARLWSRKGRQARETMSAENKDLTQEEDTRAALVAVKVLLEEMSQSLAEAARMLARLERR